MFDDLECHILNNEKHLKNSEIDVFKRLYETNNNGFSIHELWIIDI
jgi:hypothetical protein